MSWILIKKWWSKASVWCRQHWRWLVLLGGFAIVAILYKGRGNARALLIQAKLAKKQYEKEAEAIEKAYEKEMELREQALKDRETAAEALVRTNQRKIDELGKRRREELEKLNTDEKVNRELRNMGINEHE